MTDLEIAVVGFGLAGRCFHVPVIRSVRGLSLRTIVTSQRSGLPSGVSVAASIDEVIADPRIDLVVIATPNATHAPLAHKALAAGKHVVIDKPLATTFVEAQGLVAHAEQVGRHLIVFHNRRWDSDFMTLKSLRDSGQLGDVVEMRSSFDRYRPDVNQRWREEPGAGAGLWLDLGPHLLDQALQLFGRPREMQADIGTQRKGALVDDYFDVTLHYGRLRVHLHASSLASWSDERFVVHGTKASFVKHGVDPQEEALRAQRLPDSPDWGRDPHPGGLIVVRNGVQLRQPVPSIPGDYRLFYAGVHDTLLHGAPPPVSTDDALLVMRLLEEAQRATIGRGTRDDLPAAAISFAV